MHVLGRQAMKARGQVDVVSIDPQVARPFDRGVASGNDIRESGYCRTQIPRGPAGSPRKYAAGWSRNWRRSRR